LRLLKQPTAFDMKLTTYTLFLALSATVATAQTTSSMQDIAYPPDTKTVTLSEGTEIAYIDRGEGPYTLVFVHGLGTYLKSWQYNVDVLSMQYRCIALDLPGYGKSSKGDYLFDMAFFADYLQGFCAALNLESVVLVGHSMGGQVALTLALNDSVLVKKLVLIAPAGIETFSEEEANWLRKVYTPEVVKSATPEQLRKNYELNFFQWSHGAEALYRDRLLLRETVEYDGWSRMIPQCVAGMLDQPVFGRLGAITQPTLIIFGENDALIPNTMLHPTQNTHQIAQLAQASIPGSRLRLLPQAGHFVHWDQAALTNQAIREFLEE